MKMFHKKFLDQNLEVKNDSNKVSTPDKSKVNYLMNQFLIWILILSILFFIIKFLYLNTNLTQ
jgi:hypothetical protein